MGMDLIGLNPKSDRGKYFRSSIPAWYSLIEILRNTCPDILADKLIDRISVNGGQRITVRQSNLIAYRLAQYMEHNIEGNTVRSYQHPLASVCAQILADTLKDNSISALERPNKIVFKISDKHLKEFAEFLHDCGGFTVH